MRIACYGSKAFVADYHLGLVLLDISDVTKPELAKTFDAGKIKDVYIYEDYLYASVEKGISVFKIE